MMSNLNSFDICVILKRDLESVVEFVQPGEKRRLVARRGEAPYRYQISMLLFFKFVTPYLEDILTRQVDFQIM